MKQAKVLLTILSLCSINLLSAQVSNVNVTVTITPPYSPYIADYVNTQNKTLVTLLPNGAPSDNVTVYFKASITGDNNVSIQTKPGFKPAEGLFMQGGIPRILSGKDLEKYFDVTNMNFNGITFSQLYYGNGLPEGTYTLCVQVFDYNTDLPLSQMAPLGCSAPIMIQHVDPPLPLSPVCGNKITVTPVQNVLFNWSYNPGFTSQLQYLLKIVPVLPGQNPNDAINSMVTPAFFEKIVKSTSYLYGPADPKMEKGKTYAYRIKVFDPANKIQFKNNGESEVCTFIYGAADTAAPVVTTPKGNSITLQGHLDYYYRSSHMEKVVVKKNGTVTMENKLVETKTPHPLANQTIQLKQVLAAVPVYTITRYDAKQKKNISYDSIPTLCETPLIGWTPGNGHPGAGTIVATTTTDEAGNYNFSFSRSDNPLLSDAELGAKNEMIADDGQKWVYIRAYMLDIVSKYYGDPLMVINVEKGGKASGLIIQAPVKQYTLKLSLKNYENQKQYYTSKNTPLNSSYKQNAEVYILRRDFKKSPPQYEAGSEVAKPQEQIFLTEREGGVKNSSGNFPGYYVIYKKTVAMNGILDIKGLVQNMYGAEDEYYIFARVPGTNIFYTPQKLSFNTCSYSDCGKSPDVMLWELSNPVPETSVEYSVFQSNLSIKGSLKFTFADDNGTPATTAAKPLGGIKVNLVGSWVIKPKNSPYSYEYSTGTSYATTTTSSDGDFTFPDVGYVGLSQLGGQGYSWNKNQTKTITDKNGNSITVTGDLNYVLRIQVQSPYYYSPDNDFLVEPGYVYDVGTLYASVRECNPAVSKLSAFNPDIQEMSNILNTPPKGGEKVYLLRKKSNIPSDFPLRKSTFSKDKITWGNTEYIVVDEAVSTNEGTFSFTHVVLTDAANAKDYYSLYSESPKTSIDNYKSGVIDFVKVSDPLESKTYFNSNKYLKQYNSQQKITKPVVSAKLVTIAQAPVISGAIYPESNMANNPLEGVYVALYDLPAAFGGLGSNTDPLAAYQLIKYTSVLEQVLFTGDNGKFEFTVDNSKGKSGKKMLYFYKNGFNLKVIFVNDGKKLIMGQRAPLNKVLMELPLTVKATVKNQAGEYVDAKVIVGDDFSWADIKTQYLYKTTMKGNIPTVVAIPNGQKGELLVPTTSVKIKIFPADNNTYMPSEEEFTFTKNEPKVIDLTAKPRQHEIHITGVTGTKNDEKEIPVTVTITNINPVKTFKSSSFTNFFTGQTYINTTASFASAGTVFNATLTAEGYMPKEVTILSTAGTPKYLTYKFEKAVVVKGKVVLNGKPVKNASVFVEDYPQVKEVKTDESGKFSIAGVKQSSFKVTFTALPPPGMNALGASKEAVASASGELVLELTDFTEMNISDLHGFPMQVSKLKKVGDEYVVDCRINIADKKNTVFAPNGESYLAFNGLRLKKRTKLPGQSMPHCEMVKNKEVSPNTFAGITVFGNYSGLIERASGIEFKKGTDNQAAASVCGNVYVAEQSFEKGIRFNEKGFYLSSPDYKKPGITSGVRSEVLRVFTSESITINNKFRISSSNFSDVKCKISNRYTNSELISSGSVFTPDGIEAECVLHTNIKQFENPDINLNIGKLYIDKTGPGVVNSSKEINIPLGKWKLATKSYTLSPEGLVVDGNIMAGLFAIPTKDLLIDYDKLMYGTYDVSQVKLGGYIPLNLNESNAVVAFGFDKGYGDNGCWSLTLMPKGSDVLTALKSLPDLNAGDHIDLASVALYSTGDDALMVSEQTPFVTLNGIASYKPAMGSVYPGGLKFRGPIDLNIPKCPELAAYDLNYELDKNNKLVHKHNMYFRDANLKPIVINTKGVVLSFSNDGQQFSDNKLVMKGKITDQDPAASYNFEYTFTKTISNKGTLVIDESKKQYYYMSGNTSQGLENIKGSMTVASGNAEWNRFKFSGDMFGYNGISKDKRTMAFEVKGDLVANNTELGVKNMDAGGIGNMSITYDMQQQALIGSMHTDRDYGSYYLKADMEIRMGGSGWYIFGAGEMEIKDMELPVKRVKSAFFVGNSSMTAKQTGIFANFFYKNLLPDKFPKGTIQGAVFGAAISFPIPKVPQINIPLSPVVHVTLEHQINMNAYFAVNFAGDPSLSVGAQVYVYVHLGAGASIGLACAGADFKVTAGATGEAVITKSLDFSLVAKAFLQLTGSAYVGVGGCEDDCSDICWCLPGCYTTDWSKTISMDFTVSITRTTGKTNFDVAFGAPSW